MTLFIFGNEVSVQMKTVIDEMTLEVYEKLKKAVELGKWESGQKLTQQQMEVSMQATLLYAASHDLDKDELFTIDSTGEILTGVEAKKSYRENALKESIAIEIQNNKSSIKGN